MSPSDRLMAALDEAGFTSVVATNCDQHYERPLVPGDELEVTSVIDSVSPEKATGLGVGHFITTRLDSPTRTASSSPPCCSASSSSGPAGAGRRPSPAEAATARAGGAPAGDPARRDPGRP